MPFLYKDPTITRKEGQGLVYAHICFFVDAVALVRCCCCISQDGVHFQKNGRYDLCTSITLGVDAHMIW